MTNDINDKIAKYGWSVVSVGGENDEYPFAYSIGLQEKFGCSEILAFSTSASSATELIYLCVDFIESSKMELKCDEPVFGIINESLSCMFFQILKINFKEYMGHAIRYYGHENFEAMQCIWPDKNGNFPWDSGVHKLAKIVQKTLY